MGQAQEPLLALDFGPDCDSFCNLFEPTSALSSSYLQMSVMRERGLYIDHTTIYRWVQHYAPELEKRCRPHLNATNDSWRVDETYVKVKKVWMYLFSRN